MELNLDSTLLFESQELPEGAPHPELLPPLRRLSPPPQPEGAGGCLLKRASGPSFGMAELAPHPDVTGPEVGLGLGKVPHPEGPVDDVGVWEDGCPPALPH